MAVRNIETVSRRHEIKFILCCSLAVLIVFLFFFSSWYWINLAETSFNTTKTTFIGSSDVVVPLGCYSQSTVRSVTMNITDQTKVYTMEQSRLKLELSDRTLPSVTRITKCPVKFEFNNGQPFYSVEKAGYIIYNFSILLNNSVPAANDCVLNITAFDNYTEYSNFLGLDKDNVRAFNYTCLRVKSHETEGVFITTIKLAVPVKQFTYFAGTATPCHVNELNFTMLAGLVTYYKTKNLAEVAFDHCTNNGHHDCTVTIGEKYDPIDTSSESVCVLVNLMDKGTSSREYIRTDFKNKEDGMRDWAIGFSVIFVACIILVASGIAIAYRLKILKKLKIMMSHPIEENTNDARQPLLINSEIVAPVSYRRENEDQSNSLMTQSSDMQTAMQATPAKTEDRCVGAAQLSGLDSKTDNTTIGYDVEGIQPQASMRLAELEEARI